MKKAIRFGSLFAGIGGLDLGFERAGLKCAWQVEIDEWRRSRLAKHWPRVRKHDDVRTFPPTAAEDWSVEVIAGGFPCQDISGAGKKAGIEGKQSGLWREFARIIRTLRPAIAVVENVASLTDRGLDRVLGDLARMGMDAEWFRISSAALGGFIERKRIFIVARSRGERLHSLSNETRIFGKGVLAEEKDSTERHVHTCRASSGRVWPVPESGIQRVADGFPTELDKARLKAIGDAVDPRVAEWIGRRIVSYLRSVGGHCVKA